MFRQRAVETENQKLPWNNYPREKEARGRWFAVDIVLRKRAIRYRTKFLHGTLFSLDS